jgi:hypothetical protein
VTSLWCCWHQAELLLALLLAVQLVPEGGSEAMLRMACATVASDACTTPCLVLICNQRSSHMLTSAWILQLLALQTLPALGAQPHCHRTVVAHGKAC